jgi:hypothetical protein
MDKGACLRDTFFRLKVGHLPAVLKHRYGQLGQTWGTELQSVSLLLLLRYGLLTYSERQIRC